MLAFSVGWIVGLCAVGAANPFILMDVPHGNTLQNPYSDSAAQTGQPVFPWRGRITCPPAAGLPARPGKRRLGILLRRHEHALDQFRIFQRQVELFGRQLSGALADAPERIVVSWPAAGFVDTKIGS